MKDGGMKMSPHHEGHKSIWPQWEENKPFALVLLLLGAFMVVYFNARITQVQRETDHLDKPMPYEHKIVVDGTGTVTGTPDIATVTLGVDSKGEDVATTQTQNSTTVNGLLAQVKALGVEDADVQTSNYSVYENNEWNPETQTYDAKGWIVSQTLTVKVRDTAKVSAILDAAGKSGVTNVSGPSFTIDDPSNLKDQAREKAVADAKSKAEKLAAELGLRLERVVGYTEYANTPYPYYDTYALSASGSVPPTISPGSNDVSLNVSVTYKIAD
jgi:uncharacterized protein YggE